MQCTKAKQCKLARYTDITFRNEYVFVLMFRYCFGGFLEIGPKYAYNRLVPKHIKFGFVVQ